MATTKVGVYRSYYGPVPTDSSGQPLPKSEWPRRRAHSWVVRWFGLDGNRYSKSFKSRKEAEWFAEHKQTEVREGSPDPPEDITLKDFKAEHEKVMSGQVAPESLADQLRALAMFTKHIGQDVRLRDIKPRHAESFVAVRLSSKVKVPTVNKDIRTLKRIFNLAIEPRGYLLAGQNPFAKIRQRKQSPRPIGYVTPTEFQNLVGAAQTVWWKSMLSVAYTTGARLGEIVNLTWPDLDFEQNRARIASKEAGGDLSSWEPKDHEGRLLPVPPEVMQLLADLHAESAERCPYVFVPEWRWEHIERAREAGEWRDQQALLNNLNRRLATLRKKAGVAKLTFHDLRRSCITNWARHLPIHVVQKLAGHSDIKTTQQYYLSVQEDDLERARQVQREILRGRPTDQELTKSVKNEPFEPQEAERPGS